MPANWKKQTQRITHVSAITAHLVKTNQKTLWFIRASVVGGKFQMLVVWYVFDCYPFKIHTFIFHHVEATILCAHWERIFQNAFFQKESRIFWRSRRVEERAIRRWIPQYFSVECEVCNAVSAECHTPFCVGLKKKQQIVRLRHRAQSNETNDSLAELEE